MKSTLLTGTLVAGLAAGASAQPGVATYSIAFGSAAGPNSVVLEPGQSVGVFVNVSFSPGVGGGNPPAAGLSDGAFSIAGSGTGSGMWVALPVPFPWNNNSGTVPGSSPGVASANGVSGALWSYGFLFNLPHPYPDNPANIWRGTFTASSAGVISTNFTGLAATGVFAGTTGLPTVLTYASSPGVGGQVTIVPAPTSLAAVSLLLLTGRRRRVRSCP